MRSVLSLPRLSQLALAASATAAMWLVGTACQTAGDRKIQITAHDNAGATTTAPDLTLHVTP